MRARRNRRVAGLPAPLRRSPASGAPQAPPPQQWALPSVPSTSGGCATPRGTWAAPCCDVRPSQGWAHPAASPPPRLPAPWGSAHPAPWSAPPAPSSRPAAAGEGGATGRTVGEAQAAGMAGAGLWAHSAGKRAGHWMPRGRCRASTGPAVGGTCLPGTLPATPHAAPVCAPRRGGSAHPAAGAPVGLAPGAAPAHPLQPKGTPAS